MIFELSMMKTLANMKRPKAAAMAIYVDDGGGAKADANATNMENEQVGSRVKHSAVIGGMWNIQFNRSKQ